MPWWTVESQRDVWAIASILAVMGILVVLALWKGPRSRGESPEEVLKRRFASGDIDGSTYRRMLEELRR